MRSRMTASLWFLVIGVLLLGMGVSAGTVRRLPLTTALIYLGVGALLAPFGLARVAPDPIGRAHLLERITEIAVLVSLFTAGLKLRTPWTDRRWVNPVLLATASMMVTVALVALLGAFGLGLPLGAAILLGAVLAPTDPVLASDVQVSSAADEDRLRFTLTGEAGLNDGTAFPFVMLGLGLLGLHDLGAMGWRWLAVDVVWAVAAGLATGWLLGSLVARLVLWLRRERREAIGTDDMLALGLIAASYGLALVVHGYGFLAVFAAALALRRAEVRETAAVAGEAAEGSTPAPPQVARSAAVGELETVASGPETAPAYMVEAALGFTSQLERIGEVAIVLLVGALLTRWTPELDLLWFVAALFLVVRPAAVLLGAPMRGEPRIRRRLAMWFGIRGVGSIYYLAYAISHGLPEDVAARLTTLTLTVVASSVIVHGISVTPLMRRYERSRTADEGAQRLAT